MKPLTLEELENILGEFRNLIREDSTVMLQPSMMLVPAVLKKQALRILYWKPTIKRAKGTKGRKRALYWRTTK